MEDPTTWIPLLIGGGGVVLTLLLMLCVTVPILGGLIWLALRIVRSVNSGAALNQAALTWPSAAGMVLQSRVEVHQRNPDFTSVVPKIVYEYVVDGTTYQNNTIRAGDRFMRLNDSQEAYELVDRHPVGTQVAVYYNPANPAESTLIRGQGQIQPWSS